MEITRELLTGNVTLTLEVYGTPDECDHPALFKVCITPERLTQIQQMAAIVQAHRSHINGLSLWSVKAWDYSGDWLKYDEDDEGNEIAGEPERMECDAIVVSDDDLHWAAYVKHCDIQCETESVNIADLLGACTCDNTPKPWRCPVHGETGYTTERGEHDERLRTTD